MKSSRREVLRVGLGGLAVVSLSGTMPAFVSQLAYAQTKVGSPVADDNILVVVQLSGGNDGLNTVVPHADDLYYKARPQLGLKDRLLKLNGQLALNPGLTAFRELFDAGQLAIVNGCGYPEPNRSHFQSMAIWHTADPKGGTNGGWLGHYLDHCCRGTTEGASASAGPRLASGAGPTMSAVNIGSELPQALVNDGPPVPSINTIDDFRVRTDPNTPFDGKREEQIIKDLSAIKDIHEASSALQFLSRQATNAIIESEEIRKLTDGYKPDAQYQGPLGNQLRLIAQIIAGNFGTRVFYCQVGGFDTHANQMGGHENLLANVSSAIKAFMQDLGAKKLAEKVTVMCFSEFGRRVEQNYSNGTDHGTAGPMFLVGPKIKGGLYGTYPSLKDLDSGDLKYTTDFRRVYATVLDQWLNADSTKVLNNRFEPLAFLGKGSTSEVASKPATQPSGESGSDSEMNSGMMGGGMMKPQ
jgi:uncharacterized protein (DUF1501 family)